jgi:methylase of polypeptide subunit release factors
VGPQGRGRLNRTAGGRAGDPAAAVLRWAAASGLGAVGAAVAVAGAPGAVPLPPELGPPDPWLAGPVYERLLADAERRARGVHFTPRPLAEALVAHALPEPTVTVPTVCDPAMGAGAFLLAAAERLLRAGHDRAAVAAALHGADVDPGAVAVARAAVTAWAGGCCPGVADRLVVADALVDGPGAWPEGAAPFDVVVGNPPFLSQLARATSRDPRHREVARELLDGRESGYADTAGLFLLRGVGLTRPGGRVVLLQPLSLVGARDAGPVRAALAASGVVSVWIGTAPGFAARVQVCAPVVAPGTGPTVTVEARCGPDLQPAGRVELPADAAAPWGGLVAAVAGTPEVAIRAAGRVGDLAAATAGFRDLFYALAGAVAEEADAPDGLPVVTTGLIDPCALRWGTAGARLGGRAWVRPVLPPGAADAFPAGLRAWLANRRVPKLLVASQTRVLEAVADPDGRLVPCTPVVVVEPNDPADLWRLAAVLAAPPVAVLAWRTGAGAALQHDAVKLSARQVVELPLPADASAWATGAALAEEAHGLAGGRRRTVLASLGEVMTRAYGVDDPAVLAWWRARLPERA